MPSFEDNLKSLKQPSEQIAALELYGDGYEPDAVIENKPGSGGSLRIYYEVAVEFGGIGPKAAQKALELFAEKADEAEARPGAHPNIDRLFKIIAQGLYYSVKAIPRG